jgi:hypothetical protein
MIDLQPANKTSQSWCCPLRKQLRMPVEALAPFCCRQHWPHSKHGWGVQLRRPLVLCAWRQQYWRWSAHVTVAGAVTVLLRMTAASRSTRSCWHS